MVKQAQFVFFASQDKRKWLRIDEVLMLEICPAMAWCDGEAQPFTVMARATFDTRVAGIELARGTEEQCHAYLDDLRKSLRGA